MFTGVYLRLGGACEHCLAAGWESAAPVGEGRLQWLESSDRAHQGNQCRPGPITGSWDWLR